MVMRKCGMLAATSDCNPTYSVMRITFTIPNHSDLRTGTLNAILSDAVAYLGIERTKLVQKLIGSEPARCP